MALVAYNTQITSAFKELRANGYKAIQGLNVNCYDGEYPDKMVFYTTSDKRWLLANNNCQISCYGDANYVASVFKKHSITIKDGVKYLGDVNLIDIEINF